MNSSVPQPDSTRGRVRGLRVRRVCGVYRHRRTGPEGRFCLASARGWLCVLHIADLESGDSTISIARDRCRRRLPGSYRPNSARAPKTDRINRPDAPEVSMDSVSDRSESLAAAGSPRGRGGSAASGRCGRGATPITRRIRSSWAQRPTTFRQCRYGNRLVGQGFGTALPRRAAAASAGTPRSVLERFRDGGPRAVRRACGGSTPESRSSLDSASARVQARRLRDPADRGRYVRIAGLF